MVDVKEARSILNEYRKGRATLENRIKENDRWYRLRHWEMVEGSKNPGDPEPASAWLFNSLANKHADAMDNFPEPVILPREEGDRGIARILSAVIPAIMEQQHFEDEYDKHWWRKIKSGTAVYGIFWDSSQLNGVGDIAVKDVDILSLYWEPGKDDIQKSRNVFLTTLADNDLLAEQYPQLKGKLGTAGDQAQYFHDDSIGTENKTMVVDWYYKKRIGTRTVLHYCKFAADEVLRSTEDEGEECLYNHGQYPFVFDVLFPIEDSPAGFGWLDICKDPQMYIDKLDQAILKNAIIGSRRRYFSRSDGGINEKEYTDLSCDIVHYQGGGDPKDSIMPIEVPALNGVYATVKATKVDELKETSGNRDFSQGGTSSGVTAASAIAALQEAGSKLSRDMIRASYRAYERVCKLVLELIRQFYNEARAFRIIGENGVEEFVRLNNADLMMRPQGGDFGLDLGMAEPVFDIKIRAQKRSAFSTIAQNEMAKEFFAAGFFNPQLADQALACIEMMDFEGKAQVEQRIRANGGMYQQMIAMQQQMMQLTDIVNGLTGGSLGGMDGAVDQARPAAPKAGTAGGGIPGNSREGMAMKARERAQKTTEVR